MRNDECQCGNVVTDDEFSFEKENKTTHKQTQLNENLQQKPMRKKKKTI